METHLEIKVKYQGLYLCVLNIPYRHWTDWIIRASVVGVGAPCG